MRFCLGTSLRIHQKYSFAFGPELATIQRKEHLQRSKNVMATGCKHPKIRIVSRHEDTEFVECLECGEVFDSEEFRDMEIEEAASGASDEPPEDES